jgi:succinate dehydrogenase/fumarate reductase flavoprotein subunit
MAMRDAFIRNGAKAVAHIERNSELKFRMRAIHPDYISELEGSTLGGRALEPLPFDGRKLGSSFALVRPPIPEFTVLGGMMVDREDIGNLLTLTSSLKAFIYSTRIILRHAIDRLSHVRGTRLVMGNALIGRLLYSLNERNVAIAVNTEVEAIQRCTNGVDRVTLAQNGMRRTVRVKGGVILASGGFNRHPTRRAEMLPGVRQEWSPVAPGLTGTAQDLALALGAHFGTGGLSNAFWAPVSIRKRADGSVAAFPHFMMDRGKPGMIVVNQLGQRFLNESTSYHLFGIAMQDAHRKTSSIPAYLVTDADGLRRYGLGMVRPGGKRLKPYLDDGYLVQAPTLAELAYKLQVDPAGLQDSVRRINSYAETGVDPEFKRGTTDYQAFNGDAAQGGKNPTLGPIRQAPFYALRLYPGDIGAATGLVADTDARLLDRDGQPIPGLYACGNDMHSVMGGTYPGPGITLGPALAFAYLAGRHAAARANAPQRAPALPASPAGREG